MQSHRRHHALSRILDAVIVAVIRSASREGARSMADAVRVGGISVMEVALTTPGGLDVIRALRAAPEFSSTIIGAGTVLDEATARLAIDAGAEFIVTPALNEDVVRACGRYQVPCLPGAQTIREILGALEAGADIVKLFPGESLGPSFLKAARGPLPQAPLMPTGGVSAANAGDWIKAGAVALGVGGSLTAPGDAGDFAAVTQRARDLVAAVQAAR
ncbi:MAG: bifunctional 4-hydroxy-2-oxoglutarate aldolase/2-dehydro-3-deoxy-phosphogluconate aldolase [Proteobacteria bacterium]|nr:bifunctional 4-hydroxy-2-oxoglutarate aldolase/2-dehydro-3-deoxy-phosphogluconate aldolase [Pseudomonadota bacterium]